MKGPEELFLEPNEGGTKKKHPQRTSVIYCSRVRYKVNKRVSVPVTPHITVERITVGDGVSVPYKVTLPTPLLQGPRPIRRPCRTTSYPVSPVSRVSVCSVSISLPVDTGVLPSPWYTQPPPPPPPHTHARVCACTPPLPLKEGKRSVGVRSRPRWVPTRDHPRPSETRSVSVFGRDPREVVVFSRVTVSSRLTPVYEYPSWVSRPPSLFRLPQPLLHPI